MGFGFWSRRGVGVGKGVVKVFFGKLGGGNVGCIV